MRALQVAMFSLALASAQAAEISMPSEPDPFADQQVCSSFRLRSFAPYVFKDWPATFDLIFWPKHEAGALMTCPGSGYASLPDDFGPLSDAEKRRIQAFLGTAKFGPKIGAESRKPTDAFLAHLEKIYELREKSDEFRAYVARYLASQTNDAAMLKTRRQRAFDRYSALLNSGKLQGITQLEALYALGYYAWRLGREQDARSFFDQLSAAPATDDLAKEHKEYLQGLVEMIRGGRADDKAAALRQPRQR